MWCRSACTWRFWSCKRNYRAACRWLYPVKVVSVAIALWVYRKHYDELRLNFSLLGVVVGLVAIAIWIYSNPDHPKLDLLMLKFDNFLGWLLLQKPGPATVEDEHVQPAHARRAGQGVDVRRISRGRRGGGGAADGGIVLAGDF